SRRRHTRLVSDWSSDVCSSDLPGDPEAIETLVQAYTESHYDVRSVLRVLFLSDFFKQARFARVKSPAELVIGTVRLAGNFATPKIGRASCRERGEISGGGGSLK